MLQDGAVWQVRSQPITVQAYRVRCPDCGHGFVSVRQGLIRCPSCGIVCRLMGEVDEVERRCVVPGCGRSVEPRSQSMYCSAACRAVGSRGDVDPPRPARRGHRSPDRLRRDY